TLPDIDQPHDRRDWLVDPAACGACCRCPATEDWRPLRTLCGCDQLGFGIAGVADAAPDPAADPLSRPHGGGCPLLVGALLRLTVPVLARNGCGDRQGTWRWHGRVFRHAGCIDVCAVCAAIAARNTCQCGLAQLF